MGIRRLTGFGDSELVIKQSTGIYQTKELRLLPYHRQVLQMDSEFEEISFIHIPRNKNDFADALATLVSLIHMPDKEHMPSVTVALQKAPAYGNYVGEVSDELPPIQQPWYQHIKEYLRDGSTPAEASLTEQRRIHRLAMKFYLSGDALYKRDAGLGLLKYLDKDQAQRLMDEIHGGVCGPHMSGLLLVKKILRTGHYWLSLKADCYDHVKRCYQCQIHGNVIHFPPRELHNMCSPWPF